MNARARLTAVRAVAAATLVVLASAIAVRMIRAAFDPFQPYPGHTADYGIERPLAMRAALPEIASRPEETVVVLGSSGVARAFVPRSFDAALDAGGKKYVSFNLAQVLLQPETALAMVKVVRRTYEAQHKRIGIAIFGISIPELTRDSVRAERRRIPDQELAFASADMLREQARTDPLGALGDGLELLLFGNARPRQVGLWVEDWAKSAPLGCYTGISQPPGVDAYSELVAFCAELKRQYPRGVPPWNPKTRGAFDYGLPGTRPMLERLTEAQAAAATSSPPAAPPDPSRPAPDDIDEDNIRVLVRAVRELEAVSDVTFVLRDILNPAVFAAFPPAQVARWRLIAERIAREGDARLLDLNDAVVAADFGDRTHLSPLAAERFSATLAARVRPIVQENHASR